MSLSQIAAATAMAAITTDERTSNSLMRITLNTAEQYNLWKARISAACWSATRVDVFNFTDDECDAALEAYSNGENKIDIVGKCWSLITNSLHDDLFLKLAHIKQGHIESLMSEIRNALLVNIAEDIQPLRLELYGATMQACGSDLQTYIAYIVQRRNKLQFLEVEVPEAEMVHVFLKGLDPVFKALQIHFSIPGQLPSTFDIAVEICRKHAATPAVHAELTKLKGASISQSVFNAVTKEKIACKNYALGKCTFGERCRFAHSSYEAKATPASDPTKPKETANQRHNVRCARCRRRGHTEAQCRKPKEPTTLVTEAGTDTGADAVESSDESAQAYIDRNPFVFVVTINNQTKRKPPAKIATIAPQESKGSANQNLIAISSCNKAAHHADDSPSRPHYTLSLKTSPEAKGGWIVDSGATTCATYDKSDCINIRDCNISVTAAGCRFKVSLIGTAIVSALNTNGEYETLNVTDCLISERFPYKLLSMQKFAAKGLTITMTGDSMTMANPTNNISFTASKDAKSGLYFLNTAPQDKNNNKKGKSLLLARSSLGAPQNGGKLDVLWKLHLRHGHRNFADLLITRFLLMSQNPHNEVFFLKFCPTHFCS